VSTLRRLAHSPALPDALRAWRLELLATAALVGGLVGMVTGAY
jgi:hypothetical protein